MTRLTKSKADAVETVLGNPKKPFPKNRTAEKAHHAKFQQSLEMRLCKLHIQFLSSGKLPKNYRKVLDKNPNKLTDAEKETRNVLTHYLKHYKQPHQSNPRIMFGHWQRRILMAFCDFIDNPIRCHNGNLRVLHYCKSKMKSLQFKQRVALVEVVTTLVSRMDVETLSIRKYSDNPESALFDENGHELMRGITHYDIRDAYEDIWNKPISKTKYTDTINMLKLAGFFDVESCYLSNDAGELRRAELRESGASKEEIEAIPKICSEAAYKWFTPSFIAAFGIADKIDMIEAKAYSIKSRIAKGLSSLFATFSPNSTSFWTKKRREFLYRNYKLGMLRYPQGGYPVEYFDSTPQGVTPLRH